VEVVAVVRTMASRSGTRPAVSTLVALALGLAAGCAAAGPEPTPTVFAVVVAHHDTELAPALSDGEREHLGRAASDGRAAPVLVLAAGAPGAAKVDLTPRRPNGQVEYGPRRDVLAAQRLDDLDAAVDRAATTTSSLDVLATIGSAVRLGATEIHVLSAGLSSTDPFDLRVSGFDVDPRRLADDLLRAHALPDAPGRTIVLSGLGRTTGRQPTLDEASQRSLRDQWLAVCRATRATCLLDDGPRADRGDVPAPLVGPVVAVPGVGTTPAPQGGQEVSLPTSVLFVAGSCALRDRAGAAGAVVAVVTQARAGWTVAVSGRTAPVGPGDGVDLATCRARAVADLLVAAGAPGGALTRVAGDGAVDPPQASRDPAGRSDPTTYPALRRVVLTLSPPARP
jgi:outer membrane protein OmpA-like peptidoglycan-associated protein